MKSKATDLIFLTRRKNKLPFYRWFISNSIALLTKTKGQSINNAKVHTAIIFNKGEDLYVREMESKGNVSISLRNYKKTFGDRMEIVSMPSVNNPHALAFFNKDCLNEKVSYDYANTFIYQVIRALGKKWFGTNTPYKRTCIEDASTMYNKVNPIFVYTEKTNPNEAYNFVKQYLNETI